MSDRQRRAFLMTAISAVAGGAVALITMRLGRRQGDRVTQGDSQPAPNQPDQPILDETAPPEVPTEIAEQEGPVVMITRAEWGARPPNVTPQGSGEHGPYNAVTNPDGWLEYAEPLEQVLHSIIIHHSALPLTDGPVEIQNLHMDEKNFADVGYQYLINERGQLFEGRPLNVRGAHAYGCNHGTVGICMIGNFEEIQPTATQLRTLDALITALLENFPNIQRMAGHKDCNPNTTLCPGANLYPLLPDISERFGLSYGV